MKLLPPEQQARTREHLQQDWVLPVHSERTASNCQAGQFPDSTERKERKWFRWRTAFEAESAADRYSPYASPMRAASAQTKPREQRYWQK